MDSQSSTPERLERVAGQQPLYATLAHILTRDIRSGKHQPASVFPSEKELTERFGVSRQTVRQALRVLRDKGLVSSHPGIGTLVRDGVPAPHRFNPVNSTEELLQFVGGTEMHAVSRQMVAADPDLAMLLDCEPGQQLSEVAFLRMTPGADVPMSYVLIYVNPRFAAAQETPPISNSPIYQNIERLFGMRVHEIRQDVTATILDARLAELLQAKVGEAALQMTRFFYDESNALIQVSISYYPSSRYTQSARFRAASN